MRLILGIVFLCIGTVYSDCQNDMEVVCYWGSWSIYRKDIGMFTTENIDPQLCTTIVYTFTGLSLDSKIQSLDSWADIDLKGFANFTGLKELNPCLKSTVAVGGWNEGSIKYSVMASTEEGRKNFADSVLRFLVYYGFDGLDFDWEYPNSRGGIPADKENFAALLKLIKETISPWGLTLSMAVPIDAGLFPGYDITVMAEVVDYVHLMAYDYVPSTSNVTGLSAPLSAIDPGFNLSLQSSSSFEDANLVSGTYVGRSISDLKSSVSNWIGAGLPTKKLVLGIPTYARNYVLKSDDQHDVGDPVERVGEPGEYTSEEGFLAYYEVMQIIGDEFLYMTSVQVDDTNYAYGSGEWITYETEATVRTKTQYAIDQNLGGLMAWSLDTDDFQGLYGKKYPLLNTINDVIKENKSR